MDVRRRRRHCRRAKPLEITTVQLDGPGAEGAKCWSRSRPPAVLPHRRIHAVRRRSRRACFPPFSAMKAPASWVGHRPAARSPSVKKRRITSFRCITPECRQCPSCLSRKTKPCAPRIRSHPRPRALMPGRHLALFRSAGKPVHHYMGTSNLCELHGAAREEFAGLAKIREDAPVRQGLPTSACGVHHRGSAR